MRKDFCLTECLGRGCRVAHCLIEEIVTALHKFFNALLLWLIDERCAADELQREMQDNPGLATV